jgi:hypothetical protein
MRKVQITGLLEDLDDKLQYEQEWNAETNTPTLANGTGSNVIYRVSVPYTRDLGAGDIDYEVDDLLIYNEVTTIWDKSSGNTKHEDLTTGNPHSVTANDVNLGNADNTADLDKPISNSTQAALDALTLVSESLADSNTIVMTKSIGKMTTNSNRDIAAITGIPTDGIVIIMTIGTGAITYQNCANSVIKKDPRKVGNYSLAKVHNIGTLASPSLVISDVLPVTDAEIITAINSELGGTDWQSSGGGTPPATMQMTAAELLAGNTTPKTLRASQGAGIVTEVNECLVWVDFQSTAYATNTTLNLLSGSTIIGTCATALPGTVAKWYKFILNDNEPETNAALSIQVATGDPTAGNSPMGFVAGVIDRNKTLFTFAPAPTLSSQTIEDASDDVLDLVFSEAVTITTAGWNIDTDGAALRSSVEYF